MSHDETTITGRTGSMKFLDMKIPLTLFIALIISEAAWAANQPLGVIQPGDYSVIPVNNHCPTAFKNSKEYWNSLQKVELRQGGQERFRDLPALHTKIPYTGEIVLGDPPQKFGVLVDMVGAEKRMYIDSDGDGSFAGEKWTPLLNEWQGLQIYVVEGPEPVEVNVNYRALGRSFPIRLSVGGILNNPGPFYKEKPYLNVLVTTWFLGKTVEDGGEKLIALVDRNNNGRFNDPEDQIFIDYNDDSFFSDDEAITRKNGVRVKSGKQELSLDWGAYPAKIIIGGKNGK